ncbi:predicted protein [Botrytis cinerea T4]|uniref:Uncharacterized protein n=1 Tax=Botryotinia fuckeliana (strain T4) TaxID=999810 RepID=G2Y9X0_BOTF4|nr:predicted protein [Botrytis cinerea T4]
MAQGSVLERISSNHLRTSALPKYNSILPNDLLTSANHTSTASPYIDELNVEIYKDMDHRNSSMIQ